MQCRGITLTPKMTLSIKYSIANQAAIFKRELNHPETPQFENEAPPIHARRVKHKAKHHAHKQIKQKWEEKQMHRPKRCGQFQEISDHIK